MANTEGALDAAEKQKVAAWLREHAAGGIIPHCQFCGKRKWMVADHLVDDPVRTPGRVVLGGMVYPHVVVICETCGYTMFFNAVMLGMIQTEEKEKAGDASEKEATNA